jgi:hypothetical protein
MGLMHGQGCRALFERSVTVSLTEKVEPKGCQAPFIEESGQGPVGRTVLAGEKSMAQHGETRRWSVRRAQDGSNAVVMGIVKCQGFFQGVIFQSSGTLGE